MTWVLIKGRQSCTVATDRLVIPASEARSFRRTARVIDELAALTASEASRIDAAVEEARRLAYEQGLEEGRARAAEELSRALAADALRVEAVRASCRKSVVSLAMAVVRKVSQTLGASKVMPKLVEQALATTLPEEVLKIRVHPKVARTLETKLAAMESSAEVVADEGLGLFDCIAESVQGQHVLGLDRQLDAIEHALDAVRPAEYADA